MKAKVHLTMYSGLTLHRQLSDLPILFKDMKNHLYPVPISPIQHIFRIRMLDDQSFPPRSHNVVHALPYILGSLPFVLNDKLDSSFDFLNVGAQVSFAEF